MAIAHTTAARRVRQTRTREPARAASAARGAANFAVASQFDLMADVLELKRENPFRIRAYRRAAQNLRALSQDAATLAREGRLDDVPGFGADLAGKVKEWVETGRIAALEQARRGVPRGVVELLGVPGIGPLTAKRLYERYGVTGLAKLEHLARAGKLRGLQGIQAKTEQNILQGIAIVRAGQERMPLGTALPLGEEIARALRSVPGVRAVELAGSLRRRRETVGDIDVLVTSRRPAAVMDRFVALPQVAAVLERGDTKAAIRHRAGIQVDLRVVPPASFGAALAYFTGSKQHNIRIREMGRKKGLTISEYGVFRAKSGRRIAGATEQEVYAAVGLPWIAPELREDAGEIEAALAGALPRLLESRHVKGDLHCHTKASDGHHTIDEIVTAAERRGYAYVVIADHSRSTRIAGGLTVRELQAHVKRIRAAQRAHPKITVLAGTECDILPDGSLDYPDHVLAELDLVVAAVHGTRKQSERVMTKRICAALANPHVDVLGHPTGRLIGRRSPYAVDMDAVLRAAKRYGKAVEVNAHPERLDLCDRHARRAHELGVLVAVSTDTHVLDDLAAMDLGVATARRGWTERSHVINTWPVRKLTAWTAGHAARRRADAAR
jgi:DNA polymerase (family 10)